MAAPELETGPVAAVLELRTVLVAAPELETALEVAVLELRTVPAAEPAANPVEAQVLVQVAAPARIKSATAARRPGQVPLLAAEEDLAAVVAEITHGPAATEAATAWAAAE